jgi:uncharacterized protein (PEP-CTERM system associated)
MGARLTSVDEIASPRTGAASRPRIRTLGVVALLLLIRTGSAGAFPLLDTITNGQVPQGTDLSGADTQDLRHQLQLVNGLGAPAGGGWTFVPRVDLQEMLTDNVLQQHSPRQYDLGSFLSPGFNLAGDMPRLQLNFNYAPTLAIYARTGSLNALTQQMNGIGTVTVVPDLAFVDVRALAGVHSLNGGLGGTGAVGAPAGAGATAQTTIPTLAGNAQGLNKNNETQVTSFGVSPYLLHRFGDWGVGRLGYSLDVTRSNALSGFASPPFPTGGVNGQTLVTNEQTGHFASGDILNYFQNSIDMDLVQTRATTDAGFVNGATGVAAGAPSHTSSNRAIFTDQINYVVNRTITVFASGGHENIAYSGSNFAPVSDLTWSFGTTLTPNPDTALTMSYGHLNGFNSFTANGHYALTARTLVSVSYGTTLGTQLENLQNQFNLATTSGNGTLVNGQTGGQLFGNTNALAVQDGVFRTETLTVGSETSLDRDIVSLDLSLSKQTSSGAATGGISTTGKTASASWLRQMRPDMTVSAAVSYSLQEQGGVASAVNPGNLTSIAGSIAWQWQISETVSSSLRYSFFERQSANKTFDIYQNMLILGISKAF